MLTLRRQIGLILVALHNVIYNAIPFFVLKNAYLRALGNSIGDKTYIHTFVRLVWFRGLTLGRNCTVNYGCVLSSAGELTIGDNVMIGHACKLYTVGHDIDSANFDLVERSITIGDDVVVFPNSIVMPGVTIGKGAVVLNGSVVTKPVGPYDVVGGNPAHFIRKRAESQLYRLDNGYWFVNS
jgi:acetyltransferase-like isoleucine patch superfamily enzyme